MSDKILSPKDPREIIPVTFNAAAIPVYSIDTAKIEVTVHFGTDVNHKTILLGLPKIFKSEVTQMITGGLPGVEYNITASIFVGDAKYIMTATLPVVTQTDYLPFANFL